MPSQSLDLLVLSVWPHQTGDTEGQNKQEIGTSTEPGMGPEFTKQGKLEVFFMHPQALIDSGAVPGVH